MTGQTEMDKLIDERWILNANCGSDGAFPGSAAWRRGQEAEAKLDAFDAQHPEVVVEINRRAVEARKARLAGRDIMGM